MTILKILTYALESTWSSVSSRYEHVPQLMQPWVEYRPSIFRHMIDFAADSEIMYAIYWASMFYSPIFGEYYWYQPVHKRKHATGKVIWVPFNYRNIIWTLSLVFFVISWQKSTLSSLSPHTQWRLIEGEIESIENNMLLQSNPIETNETTYLWLNPLFDWTPESALQWGLKSWTWDLLKVLGFGWTLGPVALDRVGIYSGLASSSSPVLLLVPSPLLPRPRPLPFPFPSFNPPRFGWHLPSAEIAPAGSRRPVAGGGRPRAFLPCADSLG